MLPYYCQLFAILVILLSALPRTYSEVLATDICAMKNHRHKGNILRVVIPMQAGREGVKLQDGWASFDSEKIFNDNQTNATWSFKFYVKIKPQKEDSLYILYDDTGDFNLFYEPDDTFYLFYVNKKGEEYQDFNKKYFDYAKGNIIFQPTTDESDWDEKVGMKMKVSSKKKRETTSDNHNWKMIGIEYSKHPNKEGYLKVFINGKQSINETIPKEEYIVAADPVNIFDDVVYSCIQYHNEPMGDDYYKDFYLNECKKKYEGEPEEKFLECELAGSE